MTGGSLADAFRLPEEFSIRRSLEIAVDTARGLAYMHNKKPNCIIHRDLKPGNLMISGSAYHELCVSSLRWFLVYIFFGNMTCAPGPCLLGVHPAFATYTRFCLLMGCEQQSAGREALALRAALQCKKCKHTALARRPLIQ